jgi:amino acid transporter
VSIRGPPIATAATGFVGSAIATGGVRASGETPLQLTEPLLWVMLALTVAGAIVTYAFLVYAVWRFRDPAARKRRHG